MINNKLFSTVYRFAVAILLAIVMVVLVQYDFSPGLVLRNSKIAARSLYKQMRFYYNFYTAREMYQKYEFLWSPASYERSGVVRHDRERSSDGLTFFTGHEARAYLMDNDGNILHQWYMPFSRLWPEPKHARTFQPDKMVYWHKARLFNNGDILAIYEGPFQEPYGVGIVKLNKDSEVIWKSEVNAHHDLDIDEDGNIFVLSHKYVINEQTRMPFIRDSITILSPGGETLRVVDLYGKLLEAGYGNILDLELTDPTHTNDLDILDAEMAKNFPMFEKGDILISVRNPSRLFVLDGKTFEPKWELKNLFAQQHDPDFLESGLIRVFDNYGNARRPGGASRIVDIDPVTRKVVWQYTGTKQEPFFSPSRGAQQQLPNSNILITESNMGRLFEITPAGQIVWEYISPSYDGTSIGILDRAVRYNKKELKFLSQRDQEPEEGE